jgi:hypothetical protein
MVMSVPVQKEIFKDKHTSVYYYPQHEIVVLKLITTYVPLEHFKNALLQVKNLADQEKISKMILDKSNLRIFHQPSMEWYHVIWKEEMLSKGLHIYRKILPEDPLFEESVKIGREKIIRENPAFNLNKFNIVYCKSLEEAFSK